MRRGLLIATLALVVIAVPTLAAESTAYTYDELGRLVASSNSGGPRSGKTNSTAYDPAGNRSVIAVGQPLTPPLTNAATFAISGPATVNEGAAAQFIVTKSGTASGPLNVNYNTVSGSAVTTTYVLTFDALNCVTPSICAAVNGYGPFLQSYGDVAGVVDVSYRALSGWGNAAVIDANLNYFGAGYGALQGVAWGGTDANKTNNVPQYGEITIRDLAGSGLNLKGLDTAGWNALDIDITFRVYDLSYNLIYDSSSVAPAIGSKTLDISVASSSGPNGLILQWGPDSYYAGIDNLSFSIGPTTGDFVAKAGVLSFRSWETAKPISVPIIEDGLAEGPEQFSVVLSSPSVGSTITTGSFATTINASTGLPVANTDTASAGVCRLAVTIDVLANDTDPGGNLPLALVSVGAGTIGTASILGGKVKYKANTNSVIGNDSVSYTIKNAANVMATGSIQINVFDDGGCL